MNTNNNVACDHYNFSDPNFTASIFINKIAGDFQYWEANTLKAANAALYEIIARCYALSLEYNKSSKLQRQIDELLKEKGIRKRKDNSTHAKILNLVFEGDAYRRKRSVYAKAMLEAERAGTKPNDLAVWIDGQGGLEAIRGVKKRVKPSNAGSEAYRDRGKKALAEWSALDGIKVSGISTDAAKEGFILLVCKVDGTDAIPVATVPDDASIDAVLKWASSSSAETSTSVKSARLQSAVSTLLENEKVAA